MLAAELKIIAVLAFAYEVRQFSTTRLPSGAKWSDYTVRVESEVNGELQTREQTVSLKAGESRDLTIDFSAAQVASKETR